MKIYKPSYIKVILTAIAIFLFLPFAFYILFPLFGYKENFPIIGTLLIAGIFSLLYITFVIGERIYIDDTNLQRSGDIISLFMSSQRDKIYLSQISKIHYGSVTASSLVSYRKRKAWHFLITKGLIITASNGDVLIPEGLYTKNTLKDLIGDLLERNKKIELDDYITSFL